MNILPRFRLTAAESLVAVAACAVAIGECIGFSISAAINGGQGVNFFLALFAIGAVASLLALHIGAGLLAANKR